MYLKEIIPLKIVYIEKCRTFIDIKILMIYFKKHLKYSLSNNFHMFFLYFCVN